MATLCWRAVRHRYIEVTCPDATSCCLRLHLARSDCLTFMLQLDLPKSACSMSLPKCGVQRGLVAKRLQTARDDFCWA